jgi:hypothetical protein
MAQYQCKQFIVLEKTALDITNIFWAFEATCKRADTTMQEYRMTSDFEHTKSS